jgi:hypothetical protein
MAVLLFRITNIEDRTEKDLLIVMFGVTLVYLDRGSFTFVA